MPAKKYIVSLTENERTYLQELTQKGKAAARKINHARILLKADISQENGGWNDHQISEALDVSRRTIERVRQRFVEEGLEQAINPRPQNSSKLKKIDGETEAHLIALACSETPTGYHRWTLRLLAEQMVVLEYVESISHESIRQVLKKTKMNYPAASGRGIRIKIDSIVDFGVAAGILGLPPLPPEPGQPERFDYQYEREGVSNIFMFFEPLKAWRHVEVTDQRTSIDYAQQMKYLVDERYPDAEKIRVVQDNLNTHVKASLYKAFPPPEARRILDKLEFYYTPKHGSWLNMAEIELSVLNRQCLNRRISDKETLIQEVEAWEQQRNQSSSPVDWQFTTEDARIKLTKLYPSILT